jgi:hypothetical protein
MIRDKMAITDRMVVTMRGKDGKIKQTYDSSKDQQVKEDDKDAKKQD